MPATEIAPIENPKTGVSKDAIESAIRSHFARPNSRVDVTHIYGVSYRVNVKEFHILASDDIQIKSERFAGSYFVAAHVENGTLKLYDRTKGHHFFEGPVEIKLTPNTEPQVANTEPKKAKKEKEGPLPAASREE